MAELLSEHPVFKNVATEFSSQPGLETLRSPTWRIPLNLLAYAGSGRLFLWNSRDRVLHALDIEQTESVDSTSELPTALHTKKVYKTFQPLSDVNFEVRFITFNRSGWSVVLAGDHALVMVDLTSQVPKPSASQETLAYSVRASRIGKEIFQRASKALHILQVAWHPFSDTHIGVLSSDCVFRLFDLSRNVESPEQEYHLQSQLMDRSTPATYARPVAFHFGGGHLWDRFAVFLLYSNGSIYALCPVSPFGSLHNVQAIEELHRDACQWTISGIKASGCAAFTAAWLESVFPALSSESGSVNPLLFKAVPHVPITASVRLQGPLPVIMGADITTDTKNPMLKCRSPASMLMYSNVGKDSVLAISFRDGQMHLYALADELQPMWNDGVPPRLELDNDRDLVSFGMLVETDGDLNASDEMFSRDMMGQNEQIRSGHDGVWTGQLPPLLQLAVIDFALPSGVLEAAPLSMLGDPVVPERLYCHHAAGIDAIVLQWLPFSDQSINRASSGKPPTVYPILDTCPTGNSVVSPLLGIAQVLDGYGEVWLVAVTSGCECAVIGVRSSLALDPLHLDGKMRTVEEFECLEGGVVQVISKELSRGPKDIPIPHVSSEKPLTLDSIEGKELLHDQWKLLHEKYIEYAHRVHVELSFHADRLDKDVRDQRRRLSEAQSKISKALELSESLTLQIGAAVQKNKSLKARVKKHRAFIACKQMPLTASEREYVSQLGIMRLHDLDILHSAVDVLKDRFKRCMHLSQTSSDRASAQRVVVPDAQKHKLKASLKELTQTVEKSLKQVKRIDEAVKKREQLEGFL